MSKLSEFAEKELGLTRIEEIKLSNSVIVVHGRVNGFHVDVHISDEDMKDFNETGTIKGDLYLSGIMGAMIDELKKSGVEPLPMSSGGGGTEKTPAWKNKTSWKCPEHGDKFVKEMRGSKFCSGYQKADDDDEQGPDWAKDEPKEYKGQWNWYCKYNDKNS